MARRHIQSLRNLIAGARLMEMGAMPRGPLPIKQADVKRALKGALDAGVEIVRVEIDPRAGSIIILTSRDISAPLTPYDAWKGKCSAG
jgi:hypothetical protein